MLLWASLVVQNPPTNAGNFGSIPGWEDSLKKGMPTHSGILAWEKPMDRGNWQEPQSTGSQESDMT